jgi:hypothetical protein
VGEIQALQREDTRSRLALILIALLSVLALLLVWVIDRQGGGDAAKLLVTGVFTPIIGIAGTVLGFYFGFQDKG